MSLTEAEHSEASYNARDVLSMCRMWPFIVADLEKFDVTEVYEGDRQMADLALQMTRVGLPVNSDRREEIGNHLRQLRDAALETLRPYTEGSYREAFLGNVALFFAAKARGGEPTNGSVRCGPTRATFEYDEARAALKAWKDYRKKLEADIEASPKGQDDIGEHAAEVIEADDQIAAFEQIVKEKKKQLAVSLFERDDYDGLIHSEESALEIRCEIRRSQAQLALEKRGVNFGAKVQQCAILRAAGVPLIKRTEKSGLPKIDKEVLEALARHPAAKAMLSYILTEKTINVYIEGEKRAGKGGGRARPVMVTEDGYIHPEWTIHKITGRWGSSPNCQNWSVRAGGGAENLRSMIEAPEGYVFISADQKQLEARLIAAMSGCKYMLDTFARGDDIHSAFAAIGFPNDWTKLNGAFLDHKKMGKCKCADCLERGKMRDVTKRLEYGFFYGGKEQTLFESIAKDFPNSTLGQVRDFINRLNSMLPEVLRWRQQILDTALRNRMIRSPILGRMQIFPLGRVDPNVIYNFGPQSGGADIWLIGALRFMELWDQMEFDARLIQNGHDSVLVLVREELAEPVEKDVCECWSLEWSGVQFEMESKIVKRWSGD
jgi:hypothetical protein